MSSSTELFSQLQRLSCLQSLLKVLEREIGPAPVSEGRTGYLNVARMLLDTFEQGLKACREILRSSSSSSSSSYSVKEEEKSCSRRAFTLLLNQKVQEASELTLEMISTPLSSSSSSSSSSTATKSNNRKQQNQDDNEEMFNNNNDDDDDEDQDEDFDSFSLLSSSVEEIVFNLLYSRLSNSGDLFKKAISKGAQTMLQNAAAEIVEAKIKKDDEIRKQQEKRAAAFERELRLRSNFSSSLLGTEADFGVGIDLSSSSGGGGGGGIADAGIENDGSDDTRLIEIERCDREPAFLRSMGVNFREKLLRAEKERKDEEVRKSRQKQLQSHLALNKRHLEQQQKNAATAAAAGGGFKNNNTTVAKTSMQLAVERREQYAKEKRAIDYKNVNSNNNQTGQHQQGGGGEEKAHHTTFGSAAFTRDLDETNETESGSTMMTMMMASKQQKQHQHQQHQKQSLYQNQQQQQNSATSSSSSSSSSSTGDAAAAVAAGDDQQQQQTQQLIKKYPVSEEMARKRASLPIADQRDHLISVINSQRVTVVSAETGSGKTTQIPRYLYDAGFHIRHFNNQSNQNNSNNQNNNKFLMIACTQPRLIAAKTVAQRVADEFGCPCGAEVGYTVRFDDCTTPNQTVIKYMTDGVLLREALLDDSFSRYSVIVLDEAHERNLNTDILFALCKKAVEKNPRLTLIVTSATLDVDKFCNYFGCPEPVSIEGKMYKVDRVFLKEPCDDYFEEALLAVMRIHVNENPGDILVFFTGKEEIENARKRLDRWLESDDLVGMPPLIVTRLYAGLPDDEKARALSPAPHPLSRKVVLSTNIAETSVTIEGLYYVVDCGFCKESHYNPKTGVDTLAIVPISQAQAKQRMGRAGRVGPGKCFFLYTEHQLWNECAETSTPEIKRTNLANVVLTLKAIGISNPLSLDFMDPPPHDALVNALEHLYFLGALNSEGDLTELGHRMSQLPVSPNESKTLLTACDLDCLDPVLTIVAMLGEQHVFHRPRDFKEEADRARLSFTAAEGDHITLLKVYTAWQDAEFDKNWCKMHFVSPAALQRCKDLRAQLQMILNRDKRAAAFNSSSSSSSSTTVGTGTKQLSTAAVIEGGGHHTVQELVNVRKALVSGYFYHAAKRNQGTDYVSLADKRSISIHPTSVLYHTQPKYIIYHDLVETTKEYMREVVSVDPSWLLEMAPSFFSSPGEGKKTKEMERTAIDPILRAQESHTGFNSWRISRMTEGGQAGRKRR